MVYNTKPLEKLGCFGIVVVIAGIGACIWIFFNGENSIGVEKKYRYVPLICRLGACLFRAIGYGALIFWSKSGQCCLLTLSFVGTQVTSLSLIALGAYLTPPTPLVPHIEYIWTCIVILINLSLDLWIISKLIHLKRGMRLFPKGPNRRIIDEYDLPPPSATDPPPVVKKVRLTRKVKKSKFMGITHYM